MTRKLITARYRKSLKIPIANHACYELIFVLCPSLARWSKFEIFKRQNSSFVLAACDKTLPGPYLELSLRLEILRNANICSQNCSSGANFTNTCFDRETNDRCDSIFALNGVWILLRKVRTTLQRNVHSVNVSRNLALQSGWKLLWAKDMKSSVNISAFLH